jgi:hypothetical protein
MPKIPRPESDRFESQWLPIYDTRTSYNEDEIVSLLHEFEHMYMKLSSVDPETISWAPDDGHEINEKLCREMGMDSTVISLLPHLTYSNIGGHEGGIHVDSYMSCVDYRNDNDVRGARYGIGIPPFDFPEDQVKILPHEVILAWGDREVDVIILDTKESGSPLFALGPCINDHFSKL